MAKYIARRLLQAVVTMFVVVTLVFFVMRLLPGDPILLLITADEFGQASAEQIEQLRREHGLDRPLIIQYFDWLGDLLRGDFGDSIIYREPVLKEIKRRLPVSLHLGLTAFIIGGVVGTLAGIIAAVRRRSTIDTVVTSFANIGVAAPAFWVAVLMIYVFGFYLKWLPIFGYTYPWEDFWQSTRQSIMPVAVLSLGPIAIIARQTRSAMLEVIRQDYIRTAWAKGLTERAVIWRHALKNALIPVITIQGLILGGILGGSTIVEIVFNIPGMGNLAVEAARSQDYPVVQAVTILVGGGVILINLLVDLLYSWVDPRVHYD